MAHGPVALTLLREHELGRHVRKSWGRATGHDQALQLASDRALAPRGRLPHTVTWITDARAIKCSALPLCSCTTTAPKPRCSHRTGRPRASPLVSGLRSEHSNPSRSTLARSGLNKPSVAPETQSAPGSSDSPSGPRRSAAASRGGQRTLGDGAGIGRARAPSSAPSRGLGGCARAPSFSALRGSRFRGLAPLRNSIQTTLVLLCPLAIFSCPLRSS